MTALLFRDDPYEKTCEALVTAADETGIQLDRTVFYARGGGQAGDSGGLRLKDGREIPITDTIKAPDGDGILHIPGDGAGLPEPGARVTAEIDWNRRYRLMRMHSCLHLLSALVDGAVTGGQVHPEKGRLDFDIDGAGLDKVALTDALNKLVETDTPIAPRWVTDDELAQNPALVKTMSVAPPRGQGKVRLIDIAGVDLQACGGTHVARTSEIGAVVVRKIENKGRQNRRITIVFQEDMT